MNQQKNGTNKRKSLAALLGVTAVLVLLALIIGPAGAQNESSMFVQGTVQIGNGDASPSVKDGTDFGSTLVGSGQVDHEFKIINAGRADLNLTGSPKVAISGAAAGDFTVTKQPNSPIGFLESETFTIRFTPSAAGLRHATVSIASNDPRNPRFTFAIQGTGTATAKPRIEVSGKNDHISNGDNSPSGTDNTEFGSVVAGSGQVDHEFEIINAGTADLNLTGSPKVTLSGAAAGDFTVAKQPQSPIANRQNSPFTIRFEPSAEGLRHATVSIASNDSTADPFTFAIQGTGTGQAKPHITVNGNRHQIANGDATPSAADNTDFGGVAPGSSVEGSFFVENLGQGDLTLTGKPKVAISGAAAGDFQVITQPDSPVAEKTSTPFVIRFTPSAAGLRHATVSIENDDGSQNPFTFAIEGKGTAPGNPDMSVWGNKHEISNGDKAPQQSDQTDFGSAAVGSGGVEHAFTITNYGTGDLALTGTPRVAISGAAKDDFKVTVEPGTPLSTNHSTVFKIRFTPSAAGLRHATVSMANNDAKYNPFTFAIQGTGTGTAQKPHMDVNSNHHKITNGDTTPSAADNTDIGSAKVGGAHVDTTYHIFNLGQGDLNLTGTPKVAISGAAAGDFTVITDPGSPLKQIESSPFVIRFSPSAAGLRHATVSIENNDTSVNPFTFAIQGTGTAAQKPHMDVNSNHHKITNGDTTPSAADNTDIGSAKVGGAHVDTTYHIFNIGQGDLNLTGTPKVAISGAAAGDFTVITDPGSPLKQTESSPFVIRFSPSAAGLRHATVSIENNDTSVNPFTFAIQGTGTAAQGKPHIQVVGNSNTIVNGDTTPSQSDLTDFGGVDVGKVGREVAYYIYNKGTGDLQLTGTPKVAISGAAAGDFKVTVEPGSPLGPGHNTVVKVRFSPSTIGQRHATVSIANNVPGDNPYTFAIQGRGDSATLPRISVNGNTHPIANGDNTPSVADNTDFGSTSTGSGVEHQFKVINFGSIGSDLNLTGTPKVAISGAAAGDFQVITQPGSPLSYAHDSPFVIRFTPSAAGLRHATVSIANNDASANPYTFAIQGTGTAQAKPHINVLGNQHLIANGDLTPSPSDNTNFGSAVSTSLTSNRVDKIAGANTFVEHTFQVENSGSANLKLNGSPKVAISGAAAGDFTVTAQPGSPLAPNHQTAFTIRFAPKGQGLRQATVTIENNDGARSPYTFAIEGTGTAQSRPHMKILGNAHTINDGDMLPSVADNTDFGSAVNGSGSVSHTFQIHNSGMADLNLTGTPKVSISGPAAADFTVTVQPGSPLAAGTDSIFTIRFTPSAAGLRHATVTIHNDDRANDPYTFAIEGQGTAQARPHISVLGNQHIIANGDSQPSSSDNTGFGTTTVNKGSVEHTFQIKNSGTAALDLTGTPKVSISGAAAGDFAVTVVPGSPLASKTQTVFAIRFSPTAAGLRHATVSIASSDGASSPYTFAIEGHGAKAAKPHIIVSGHNQDIANGDMTPRAGDNTDFGSVVMHDGSVEHTFQIINRGSADLSLSGTPEVRISGGAASDFTVTAAPSSPLAPNTQTSFTIRFRPNALGLRHALVTIGSSDANQDPYIFAIEGRGAQKPAPHIRVLGNHHTIHSGDLKPSPVDNTDFGSAVTAKGAVAHTFHIGNGGTSDLHLGGITISGPASGDFVVTRDPGSTVKHGTQAAFTILFTPSANGPREAVVTVTSTDPHQPRYTFAILGRGTAAPAPHIQVLGADHLIVNGDTSPNPGDNTDFGSVVKDDGVEHSFAIRNSGTADLTLSGTPKIAISGPDAGDFSVVVQPGSPLAGRTETVFSILFQPKATGLREATVSISSSDGSRSPYTFAIQGQGTAAPAPYISLLGQGNLIANGSTTTSVVDGTQFGTVDLGSTREHVFSVRNSGTADLNLTGAPRVRLSGPGALQFRVTSEPGSPITATGESRFTITFIPTVGGQTAEATVSIDSSDGSSSPYTYVIEGYAGLYKLFFPVTASSN